MTDQDIFFLNNYSRMELSTQSVLTSSIFIVWGEKNAWIDSCVTVLEQVLGKQVLTVGRLPWDRVANFNPQD